jgi:hypothetical protein
MNRAIQYACGLLGGAVIAGCNPVKYNTLNPPPHPTTERDPDSVEVFSVEPPERPFVEVAVLIREMGAFGSDVRASREIREKAAEKGCDALWLRPNRENLVLLVSTDSVAAFETKTKQAVCLVYYDEGEAPVVEPERQFTPD